MNAQTVLSKVTIGLDVGDRFTQFHTVDESGACLEEGRLRTTPEAYRRRFQDQQPYRVVLEVGTHSPWIHRLLEELGHEVIVGNARELRFIFGNDRKSDSVDAEALARVGRLDPKLLRPIDHRSEQAQLDLAVLRARDALVRTRTSLINHVRGVVKSTGHRLPKGSTSVFVRNCVDILPVELRPALGPILETISELSQRIARFDGAVEKLSEERYPETGVLKQISGVGPLTALAYVLILEDPKRFPKGRSVGAYLGLTPKRAQSAEHDPQLRITRAGNPFLRRLLVQAAHYVLGPFGPDTDLRRWGLKLAARGGKNSKKRAAVAVARKLAALLHHLWLTGEVYNALRSQTRLAAAEA
jgi:transposase